MPDKCGNPNCLVCRAVDNSGLAVTDDFVSAEMGPGWTTVYTGDGGGTMNVEGSRVFWHNEASTTPRYAVMTIPGDGFIMSAPITHPPITHPVQSTLADTAFRDLLDHAEKLGCQAGDAIAATFRKGKLDPSSVTVVKGQHDPLD